MATIVQRNCEISQAVTFFFDQDQVKFTLAGGETKEMWSRSPHVGVIYAVYMLTDIDIINFQIEMDGAQGINNCAYDMYIVQGQKTRDSGFLFCKSYEANKYSVCYESAYGMRYNSNIRIVAKNLSSTIGKVLEIIIVYATVCD